MTNTVPIQGKPDYSCTLHNELHAWLLLMHIRLLIPLVWSTEENKRTNKGQHHD